MPAPNNPAKPSLQARLQEEHLLAAQGKARLPTEVPVAPSSGTEPQHSILNPPDAAPSLQDDFRDKELPDHDLSDNEAGYSSLDLQRVKSLHEAVLAHRAMLHSALSRRGAELSLNPASTNVVNDALKLGIARADHLSLELEQEISLRLAIELEQERLSRKETTTPSAES